MESIQAFNKSVLSLVINCYYDKDYEALTRLGISGDVARKIATLPSHIRYRLEKQRNPILEVVVNEGALNSSISVCYASGDRDELYNRAIQLGAAKSTMRALCRMSSSDFASRRKSMGISESRVRPQSLSVDEEILLGKAFSASSNEDELNSLIILAEQTDIEINRIYTYFSIKAENKS